MRDHVDDGREFQIPNSEFQLVDLVRERGPMTVAAFMDVALYHPELGYYARAAQRSGRAGDFFTSVDVGPLFGELLELQVEEMAALLNPELGNSAGRFNGQVSFDLVEAGAGNGRLSADILRAARSRSAGFFESIRLYLSEASGRARAAQVATLGADADRLIWAGASLPASFEGVLIANELLDAMPVHQVVMRERELREVYVIARTATELALIEGSLSTPELADYLDRLGIDLQPGWRGEINLRALEWIRDVAERMRRGFVILIDYGHEARELYSTSHSAGTLTSFDHHRSAGPESSGAPAWLRRPGDQDLTSHVDFTSLRLAGEEAGLQLLGFTDQTYFLLGLLPPDFVSVRAPSLKTLIVPGGLGSTHKVMIFGKGVGSPTLRGCSYRMRVT